ncbi:MAG: LysR family transcriptional regulator [Cytophagales bacterium]
MNYTLNQLNIFLTIAKHENISRAAEELHLTQPAVSIQLKNFQDQFDIPLTENVGRRIYVTEFGKKIALAAQNIIDEINAINFQTAAFKGLLTGRLNVSIVSTGKYVMPFFLKDFLGLHPNIELVMDVTNKTQVIESLVNNKVDFALVSILPEDIDLEVIDLVENKLFLVGATDFQISNIENTKEFLEQIPIIFREKGSGTRQTMETFIRNHEIKVQKKMELTSNEAVKQAVIAGMGFSVMPLIGIKSELMAKTLKIIPIEGLPIQTTWQLIWHKSKKLSPIAAAYVQHLQQNKEVIQTKYFV